MPLRPAEPVLYIFTFPVSELFKHTSYDFIFLGAGCASLSLLTRMIRSGRFRDKKILLIDRVSKKDNDRTWCFWELEPGFFEEIVFRKWRHLSFRSPGYSASFDIAPYTYKMIRGADFYRYCSEAIEQHPGIETVYGDVKDWSFEKEDFILHLDDTAYRFPAHGTQVFNSIYRPVTREKDIRLLQHFKGRVIETTTPVFDPGEAILMDFRVHQEHGTTFAYVLPFSSTMALVEYTLFTKSLLPEPVYDRELDHYIQNILGIDRYAVKETEFGIIPMTTEKHAFRAGKTWQIGTAGGQTKASSGYTFRFIQKQSGRIMQQLLKGEPLEKIRPASSRFRFYDKTLLRILYDDMLPGSKVFSDLFRKNKPQQVLKFLDNETSVPEELRIISTLPAGPFIRAAWTQR